MLQTHNTDLNGLDSGEKIISLDRPPIHDTLRSYLMQGNWGVRRVK